MSNTGYFDEEDQASEAAIAYHDPALWTPGSLGSNTDMEVAARVALEPMIGPVDLRFAAWTGAEEYGFMGLNHVIIGGESGRNARPCAIEWIADVVEQCQSAKVPCFVKQLGSNPYTEDVTQWEWFDAGMPIRLSGKGEDMREWPECLRVRQHVGDKS